MRLNINSAKKTAKRLISVGMLTIKEKQPEIYLALGIIGGVTAAVMACKATTQVSHIMQEHDEEIAAIEKCYKDEEHKATYTEKVKNKDLAKRYTNTGVQLVKLYGPSMVVGGASVVSLLASHNINRKRNAALVATLASVQNSFNEYKKNVERLNKPLATEAMFDESVVAKTDDNAVMLKGSDKEVYSNMHSAYARLYDPETMIRASHGILSDMAQVNLIQNQLTDRLRANGYLFLNDAYDAFDFPPTVEGQTVGWIFDFGDPDRDNYVDLGATIVNRVGKDGQTHQAILLDFNVDGPILGELAKRDLIKKI